MPSLDALVKEISSIKEDVIAWRRHIHQNPDLSFRENNTVAYIRSVLEGLGCAALTLSNPVPTALVGNLKGGAGEGPIIALRADIDALPLDEETDVPFKSTKKGVMHACGHDTHTAMLLGAAKVLCAHVHEIRGTVRFIFQHAEELPPGGAIELIRAGVLDGVQHIFGMHVSPEIESGCLSTMGGTVMAGGDNFTVRVRGRGGHASTPQNCIDPVPIAAEVVTALQTVASRRFDPKQAPVLSITTITTGPNESHNVIPDEVKILGTVRSFAREVREKAPEVMKQIVKGVCEAHGACGELTISPGYACTVNDVQVAKEVMELAARVLEKPCVAIPMRAPLNGGEDFSAYLEVVPGCFAFLGIKNEAEGCGCHSLHSTKIKVDEEAFTSGVCMHVGFIYDRLIA